MADELDVEEWSEVRGEPRLPKEEAKPQRRKAASLVS